MGKLQFIARCVRPGRIFLARLINWLKTTTRGKKTKVMTEAKLDIQWWSRFMEKYNGISIIWLQEVPQPDCLIATDANLTGLGGTMSQQYFRAKFPISWRKKNIATLELLAVLAGLRIWANQLEGKYFWIHVDNEAVGTILNTGASKDPQLQSLLREIAYIAATKQFVIKAKHISGVSNRVPDWLSRWNEASARKNFRQYAREKSLKKINIRPEHFNIDNKW